MRLSAAGNTRETGSVRRSFGSPKFDGPQGLLDVGLYLLHLEKRMTDSNNNDNKFRNLFDAGEPIDVELSRACIPINVVRDDDGDDAFNVGVLQFANGQLAVFRRHEDAYLVALGDMPTVEQGTRLDDIPRVSTTGWEAYWRTQKGQSHEGQSALYWWVSSQSALNDFVRLLREFYGEPVENKTTGKFVAVLATLELVPHDEIGASVSDICH